MAKYIVRYGAMRVLGVFTANASHQYGRGTRVVSRTDRGLEVGEVLCDAGDEALRRLKDPPEGRIFRAMTAEDRNELSRLRETEREEFVTCGGVSLREIDFRTMASRTQPGLFLAGELLDIDGITGGFNFQSCWTTGYLAGRGMTDRSA